MNEFLAESDAARFLNITDDDMRFLRGFHFLIPEHDGYRRSRLEFFATTIVTDRMTSIVDAIRAEHEQPDFVIRRRRPGEQSAGCDWGGRMTADTTSRPRPATAARLCPVCEGDHGCVTKDDGFIMCRRRHDKQPGFVFLGTTKDGGCGMFRREGDPVLEARREEWKRTNGNGHAKPNMSEPTKDWGRECDRYADALTPDIAHELADALGLPVSALSELSGIGWSESESCWIFPERDPRGVVVGLNRRFRDGSKKVAAGGSRGLYVAEHWDRGTGPVFCVEGASDVLTLAAMGLAVVGRPSNTGGAEHLAELLRELPHDREIVVVGEMDAKPTGKWPGLEGATTTAGKLVASLTGEAKS